MAAPKEKFNLNKAFEDKMAESGITLEKAKELGYEKCATAPKGLPFKEAGIKIPYYDLQGNPTKFWRYRYLQAPKEGGFSKLAHKKPLRYIQPKDTVNELYLPPLIDWEDAAQSQLMPIIITEGEFKAAAATALAEYPTIGLGGVWCWKASKKRMDILPQFQLFNWEQRPVFIVFDSDAVTNPSVMAAENALARVLLELGAEPHIVRIPMDGDRKMGLDDYLVSKGVDRFDALLEETSTWDAARELHRLNEEVVYVRDPGIVVRMKTMQRISVGAFTGHAYANRRYVVEVPTKIGTRRVEKNAAEEWVKWPCRAEVPRITYAPGQPKVTDERELNIWGGWGCEPKKGSVALWTKLLDHLFISEPEGRKWFEQWVAYPIQHPGEKIFSSSVLWGLHHGTGKSFVGYSLFKIYGNNSTEIQTKDLGSNHNEWAENKQFIMGDEITTGNKRGMNDQLKSMITRQLLRLNPKFIPAYTVPDVINYLFTSNHPDSFFLEDDDRRFFIHEVRAKPLPDEFYKEYETWIGRGNEMGLGGPALFDHLLNLDLEGFNPSGRALMTNSKRDMMDAGRSDLATWIANLRIDPDHTLKVGQAAFPYALWQAKDLLAMYVSEKDDNRVTSNGVARELKRQGFEKAADGQPLRTKDGMVRLWIVRPDEVDIENRPPAYYAEKYDHERSKGSRK